MSELQKAWARSRLGPAPATELQFPDDALETDEEADVVLELPEHADDDSSSASSASSTGTIVPSPSQKLFARPLGAPRGRSLDPVSWTTFFEREIFLSDSISGRTHHAYITSPVDKGPLFVMHHGAGSSGLSFAALASEIRQRSPSAGILSPDARYHGLTSVQADQGMDLTLETLAADLVFVIQAAKEQMQWTELPPIVMVGHSMGGAVVTEVAANLSSSLGTALLGFVVLDVVEGSAMDALQSMMKYLSTRPSGFTSEQNAIEWHVRSRTIRNSKSARASVPGLVVETRGGIEAEGGTSSRPWRWRTDLAAMQPFWEGWFVGMSKKFLAGRGGKMLLLAGTDRLDTELTIGQMQGKYALQVFPEAGHFIHEDQPEKTAIAIVDFHRRNDRNALVLPPKVSDLLRSGRRV